jgi:hypothetical protein
MELRFTSVVGPKELNADKAPLFVGSLKTYGVEFKGDDVKEFFDHAMKFNQVDDSGTELALLIIHNYPELQYIKDGVEAIATFDRQVFEIDDIRGFIEDYENAEQD